MTDGIIQQIFKRRREGIKRYAHPFNKDEQPLRMLDELLEGIQQELIEKIKQEAKPVILPENTGRSLVDLHKLIGDNQG